ncbi:MAG: S-layer homology domain-containing protein [Clostridia bacterium]|nr:S-layer homology domain-containing protein [Clostridia bacterium]
MADYALSSVKKIAAAGIIKGRDGNLFAPKANATRAEVARMIYLCLENTK